MDVEAVAVNNWLTSTSAGLSSPRKIALVAIASDTIATAAILQSTTIDSLLVTRKITVCRHRQKQQAGGKKW